MAVRADSPAIQIDPSSSTPLYLQIAEAIRARIDSGDLSPGDALKPLREAAEQWGVNLHTVRHAYTALAREGLIETSRGARGTRVAASAVESPAKTSELETGIDRLLAAARREGLSVDALVSSIRSRAGSAASRAPVVYVVECSQTQCEAHVAELCARFDVDARSWPLEMGEPPADGAIIATYFHYNDIRRAWPQRLRDVQFVTIGPSPALFAVCEQKRGVKALVVMERDAPTAEMAAADLQALPGADRWQVEPRVIADAESAIDGLEKGSLALIPPRVWGGVSASARATGRAMELTYVIDTGELDALGASLNWRSAL